MDRLANETQDMICKWLSQNELRSLRLTCRNTLPSATAVLFEKINIYPFLESFKWITGNQSIAPYVRTVCYITKLLPDVSSLEEWLMEIERHHSLITTQSTLNPRMTRAKASRFFGQYCEYRDGQFAVLGNENEVNFLRALFETLPNLREIQVIGGVDYYITHDPTYDLQNSKPTSVITRKTLMSLCPSQKFRFKDHRHVCRNLGYAHLASTFSAMRASETRVQNLVLGGIAGDVFEVSHEKQIEDFRGFYEIAQSVRHLSLCIGSGIPQRKSLDRLAQLIAAPTALETLDIILNTPRPILNTWPETFHLGPILRTRNTWSALTSLKLGIMKVDGEFLTEFVSDVPSLRTLKLPDLQLRSYRDDRGDLKRGGWETFFRTMQDLFRVKPADFSAWITIAPNEILRLPGGTCGVWGYYWNNDSIDCCHFHEMTCWRGTLSDGVVNDGYLWRDATAYYYFDQKMMIRSREDITFLE